MSNEKTYINELATTNELRKILLEKAKEQVMQRSTIDAEDIQMLLSIADSIDKNTVNSVKLEQADKANQNTSNYNALLAEYLKVPLSASGPKVIEVVPDGYIPPELPEGITDVEFNPAEFDDVPIRENSKEFMDRMKKL